MGEETVVVQIIDALNLRLNMIDRLTELGLRLRDFRMEDIPASVDIRNRTQPDEPSTVEDEEYHEKTYPPDNPRLRLVVENAEGKFVGLAVCLRPFWMRAPGVYFMRIMLDPGWRRRGIGQALLPRLEAYGREQGADKLWTGCREYQDDTIRFLEKAGFHNFGLRFEAVLDLSTFDEGPFVAAIDQAKQAGFEFTDLVAERAIQPEADVLLYELDAETRAEVPWPGGARSEMTYEQYRQRTFDAPDSDPSGILIAKQRGRYAGLTSVRFRKDGMAHTMMTGVRREYRGQGVATALKLLSFRLMKERGYLQTLTNNDTANPPILRLNEKLGYQKRPADLQWEKQL
jgi:GNAT superfamily N-acetyltransferase